MDGLSVTEEIIIITAACVPLLVALMLRIYFIGYKRGSRSARRHSDGLRHRINLDAMLSKMDGMDEGNGEIRRISHGELVQMEMESKDKIRKKENRNHERMDGQFHQESGGDA